MENIKSNMKCVQREADNLQLCEKTEFDKEIIAVVCTCKNSATIIEKLVLYEKKTSESSSDSNLLLIIIASSVGGMIACIFLIAFIYLKRRVGKDKFKILKK